MPRSGRPHDGEDAVEKAQAPRVLRIFILDDRGRFSGRRKKRGEASMPCRCVQPVCGSLDRSTSIHGRYGMACSPSKQSPTWRAKRPAASLANSSTNRDLPIPGSPAMKTTDPRPAAPALSASSSASISAARPTSGGVPRTCVPASRTISPAVMAGSVLRPVKITVSTGTPGAPEGWRAASQRWPGAT